jgi:putative transcriptional regulator
MLPGIELSGAAGGGMTDSGIGARRDLRYFAIMSADPSKPDAPVQMCGRLLVADPSLRDGTFDRSVILLLSHDEEGGAAGLILNQPTGRVVGDFLKGDEFSPLRNLPVHHGGPVMPEQMTFTSLWWSRKSGLRWATRISAVQAARQACKPGRVVRAFIGYCGWSPGQLEKELGRQSWFPVIPQSDLLGLEHDRELWSFLLRGMSPFHRILAEAPEDPFLN